MLFKRCNPDEAVSVLLMADEPLTYRAIKIYVKMHRWEEALDLARKVSSINKWYLIILLWYRKRFLMHCGLTQGQDKNVRFQKEFKNLDNILDDEEQIKKQKRALKDKEELS